ncbi:hypothetical protein GCM10009682_62100 [Luedemannella flava]|uniref:Uncharacterized protein n=1 Tax=Luedemannella flava TaxID=349316 RepID=A0ABN2MS20_9ACTN
MPSDSTTQFVTAVKLQELRAQHTRLRVAYDRLTAEAAAGADPYQRLMHLYRGLADLTYAGRKVHPELADLGVLANDTVPGTAISADLVDRWHGRLVNELTTGRLRSELSSGSGFSSSSGRRAVAARSRPRWHTNCTSCASGS